MKTRILSYIAVLGILGSSLVFAACGDDTSAITENPDAGGSTSGMLSSSGSTGQVIGGDAGQPKFDAGLDDAGNPKDCFDPPLDSHFKIINACTNADKIVRNPKSTKIFADGGVPRP